MSQELNTISFDDFTALARIKWIEGAMSIKNSMLNSGIVRRVEIPANSGDTRKFSEIDTNEYLSYKAEGDQAARGQVQQGYTKTMTVKRMAENVGITYEMRKFNKYPEVISALLEAGQKGWRTIDRDLSHRLTFATATAYVDRDGRTVATTCGDSLQLAYSAHTLKGSTTTYRNILANNPRLSKGSIEQAERLIVEQTYNNLGELKNDVDFGILFTTGDPNTVNTAREYLKSYSDPDAAHSGVINVNKGKYRHVIIPRMATTAAGSYDSDKRYYWGLVSSSLSSFFYGNWESPHLALPKGNTNAEDIQTDDWDYRNRAAYGDVIVGANWIKMSLGDGSA